MLVNSRCIPAWGGWCGRVWQTVKVSFFPLQEIFIWALYVGYLFLFLKSYFHSLKIFISVLFKVLLCLHLGVQLFCPFCKIFSFLHSHGFCLAILWIVGPTRMLFFSGWGHESYSLIALDHKLFSSNWESLYPFEQFSYIYFLIILLPLLHVTKVHFNPIATALEVYSAYA